MTPVQTSLMQLVGWKRAAHDLQDQRERFALCRCSSPVPSVALASLLGAQNSNRKMRVELNLEHVYHAMPAWVGAEGSYGAAGA